MTPEQEAIKNYEIVDSVETLNSLIERVKKAQEVYETFSQEKVDKIFKAAEVQKLHQASDSQQTPARFPSTMLLLKILKVNLTNKQMPEMQQVLMADKI